MEQHFWTPLKMEDLRFGAGLFAVCDEAKHEKCFGFAGGCHSVLDRGYGWFAGGSYEEQRGNQLAEAQRVKGECRRIKVTIEEEWVR